MILPTFFGEKLVNKIEVETFFSSIELEEWGNRVYLPVSMSGLWVEWFNNARFLLSRGRLLGSIATLL